MSIYLHSLAVRVSAWGRRHPEQGFWLGWLALSGTLAAIRIFYFCDAVFLHTLFKAEGNNYWYHAVTKSILGALAEPDANYFPVATRLLAHGLLHGLRVGARFPFAIKFAAQWFYCACLALLLHRRFDVVSLAGRGVLALIFTVPFSYQLMQSYNGGYGAVFLVLFLMFLLLRGYPAKVGFGWAPLLFLAFFSKSLITVFIFPWLATLYFLRRSLKPALPTWLFTLAAGGALVLTYFLGAAQHRWALFPTVPSFVAGYFAAVGIVSTAFLPFFLAGGPGASAWWGDLVMGLCVAIGLAAQVAAFRQARLAAREGDARSFLVAALSIANFLQYAIVLRFGLDYAGIPLALAEAPPLTKFQTLLFSRHLFCFAAVQFLFVIYWIEKRCPPRLPGRRFALAGLLVGVAVSFPLFPRLHLNPNGNPFIATLAQVLPQLSPDQFCFPVTGFPAFSVQHGCKLHSQIAEVWTVPDYPAAQTQRFPAGTVALVLEGDDLANRLAYLKTDTHHWSPIFEAKQSNYLYFWLREPLTGPVTVVWTRSAGRVRAHYYVADR